MLKAGAAEKSKVIVKGAGPSLPQPDLSNVAFPVLVQLVNDAGAACIEFAFDANDVVKNAEPILKLKAR